MELRNGMWLTSSAGVGIHVVERVAVKQDGSRRTMNAGDQLAPDERLRRESWLHLVNADGTTLAQLPLDTVDGVQQASLAEIPESRRPSEATGAALGYV